MEILVPASAGEVTVNRESPQAQEGKRNKCEEVAFCLRELLRIPPRSGFDFTVPIHYHAHS